MCYTEKCLYNIFYFNGYNSLSSFLFKDIIPPYLKFLLDTFEIKRKKTVLFSIPFENNVFEVISYTESGSICWEYVEYQLLRKLYRWPAQKFSQLPVGGACFSFYILPTGGAIL